MMVFHSVQSTSNSRHGHGSESKVVASGSGSLRSVKPRKSCTEPQEDIELNIGGVKHQILVSSLKKRPFTLLGLIASLPVDEVLERNLCDKYLFDRHEYFFDRSPFLFDFVLNFYRTDALHVPQGVCPSSFISELYYWRISPCHVAPCCKAKITGYIDFSLGLESIESATPPQLTPEPNLYEEFFKQRCGIARRTMWILLEDPASSKPALGLMATSILFVLATIVLLVMGSMKEFQITEMDVTNSTNSTRVIRALEIGDSVCVGWFTLEYLARVWASPQTLLYLRSGSSIFDLFAILPFYLELGVSILSAYGSSAYLGNISRSFVVIRVLRILRIFRVLRVFKLARYSTGLKCIGETLKRSYKELSLLLLFIALTNILFSTVIYFLETEEANTKFTSIPAASWWCIITMTTVGYGDIFPETFGGRVVASLASVAGVIMLAFPISIIVENFNQVYAELEVKKLKDQQKTLSLPSKDQV